MFKKRLFVMTVIMLSLFIVLSACSGSFNASKYVENQLNALYKAEFKAAAKDTEEDEDDYKKVREAIIDGAVNEAAATIDLTDEQKEAYYNALDSLMKQAKYDVIDEEKVSDGYEVKVKVTPIINMKNMNNEAAAEEAMMGFMPEIEGEDSSDEEKKEKFIELFMNWMLEGLENVAYGEEEEITIKVTLKDKVYSITESSQKAFMEAIFPME